MKWDPMRGRKRALVQRSVVTKQTKSGGVGNAKESCFGQGGGTERESDWRR